MVAERLLGRWDERPRGGNNDEDRERALTLLTQATKKGSGRAGAMLGIAQCEGWGLPADEQKVLAWFDWAIERGWNDAARSRIDLLLNGKTVRDLPAAITALESQAKTGDRWAQNTLGVLLWRGEAVPQNTAAALQWLDQAAANGEWFSARSAAKIRMLGGPNLPPGGSGALAALERYSEEHGPQTMAKLAQLYAGDSAVSPWFPPDMAKAALWFQKAYDAFPVAWPNKAEREEVWRRSQNPAPTTAVE
jgi:TPR repeat protein